MKDINARSNYRAVDFTGLPKKLDNYLESWRSSALARVVQTGARQVGKPLGKNLYQAASVEIANDLRPEQEPWAKAVHDGEPNCRSVVEEARDYEP
ncbi:hypothetical protein [Rhizobium sp. YK2]|uniref:hypothetical protein n=1 Tax=Rhizobium sp. YK2 TaxID=1860096 RepID=UPI00084BDBB4|nr:hypothetical protein [Rhizobium sp. YK2]OED00697.1 hypothetical protein A9Z06_12065 [Rhizobium sp. YK2]